MNGSRLYQDVMKKSWGRGKSSIDLIENDEQLIFLLSLTFTLTALLGIALAMLLASPNLFFSQ